jgi:hypothetical protein
MALWGRTVWNHSCMNMMTKGSLWHNQASTPVDTWDKLSNHNGVITESRWEAWSKRPIINRLHCPRWWEEPWSWSNQQSDMSSEEHLKTSLKIVSTMTKIISLLHLREYTLYEFIETNTFSVCTPEGCRNFQRSNHIVKQTGFNPYILNTFVFSQSPRGWIQGETCTSPPVCYLRMSGPKSKLGLMR